MAEFNAIFDLQVEFMSVTGVDSDRAKFYLESAAWDLQVALSSFYEDGDSSDVNLLQMSTVSQADSPPGMVPSSTASPPKEEQQKQQSERGTGYAKYGSVYGLPVENSSDENEEEGQAFYAGGSERSGQQILGPGKNKADDVVDKMFKSAKDHGAEIVDDSACDSRKKGVTTFRGTGYVLGASETDSQVVAGASTPSQETREVTLKMWRNGFNVDDGPLRDYSDPANRDFLNSIRQGEIPQDLLRQSRGGEVSLNMEDHRQEDFEKPDAHLQAFSGQGHLLGSPAPNVVIPSTQGDQCETDSGGVRVVTDDSQPVTNVQIRLADGSRLVAKLNHTHTVGDLRHYIVQNRPQYASSIFSLMTTFPNKELTEDNISLRDANLLNAVIVQRMQ